MAQAKDIQHIYIEAPGLPYVPLNSPSNTTPVFVRGHNVLTNVVGDFERRPGWAQFETSNPTSFDSIKRVFTYPKWDGSSYVLVSNVRGTTSEVWKMKVGTDTNFSLLTSNVNTGVSATEANAYEYVVSNNTVYVSNGIVSFKWDGTTKTNWGIVAPTVTPTTAQVSTGRNCLVGYTYIYCFGNSTTGHFSSSSGSSATTGTFTNKQIQVTGNGSSDPQVDKIHIFRNTDGGSSFFEIAQSPIANPGTGTWNVTDLTIDSDLNTGSPVPLVPQNNPPPPMLGLTHWQNRIWGYSNNKVFFSGWEEINNGVEEESFPGGLNGNFYTFPKNVYGLATCATGLLIFTISSIYLIQGDTRDTFTVSKLFDHMGVKGRKCMTSLGRSVIWLDASDTLQMTDGQTMEEIGLPIRPDLVGIDHVHASVATFTSGKTHWLMVLDKGAGVCRVMNLDTQLWQVPWTFGGDCIYAGEIPVNSVPTLTLFLGANDGFIYTLTLNAYLDPGGNPYDAEIVTSLFDLGGKPRSGHVGSLEYLSIERDDSTLSSVEEMIDDDPNNPNSVYTDITGNIERPAMREQGDFLIEDWYYATEPRGRRVSLKMTWPALNAVFRVYSIDIAYEVLT